MIDGFRVLGLIPARGGSKGLPGKNIRDLCGKPLIAWTIDAARATSCLDAVVVSTDDSSIAAIAAKHGGIDILVNNAGVGPNTSVATLDEAKFDLVFGVNVKGTVFLSQAVARQMIAQRRGSIVSIASAVGLVGIKNHLAYSMAKHAIAGMTKCLALELVGDGIRVNAIAPGYIETNNTVALRADPDRSAAILGRIPAARWGGPDDIGDAAVFLLARASDYVHGAALPVDGGWLAR